MLVRDATSDDWPAIWRLLRRVVAAGETFAVDRDLGEEQARVWWMHEPPGRTVVAVADDGTVVGTAETHPDHGGGARHVANAGFMVDPDGPDHVLRAGSVADEFGTARPWATRTRYSSRHGDLRPDHVPIICGVRWRQRLYREFGRIHQTINS